MRVSRGIERPMVWQQKVAVGLVATTIVFMGWALGGFSEEALYVLLSLSSLSFIVLCVPIGRNESFVKENFKRLVRFPVLYIGLFFVLYVLFQYLNPAFKLFTDGVSWWIEPKSHKDFLPSSVEAPFEMLNPVRVVMPVVSSWLSMMALYLSAINRNALFFLLWVFVVNGFLFNCIVVLQKLLGVTRILGVYSVDVVDPKHFLGSFVYHNHGAAYVYLIFAVTIGLYLYNRKKVLQGISRSGSEMILLFFLFIGIFAVSYVHSRAALLIYFAIGLMGLILFFNQERKHSKLVWLFLKMVLLIGAVSPFMLLGVEGKEIAFSAQRLKNMDTDYIQMDQNVRYYLITETIEMFKDRPLFGWGAGSFMYVFPQYQEKNEALRNREGYQPRLFMNTYSDIVQVSAEFGTVGIFLVVAFIGTVAKFLYRRRKVIGVIEGMLLLGCLMVLVHSSYEFIFRCPSLLYCFSIFIIMLWLAVERRYEKSFM